MLEFKNRFFYWLSLSDVVLTQSEQHTNIDLNVMLSVNYIAMGGFILLTGDTGGLTISCEVLIPLCVHVQCTFFYL